MATEKVHEPDLVDDGPNALQLRNPQVPVTIEELAARGGEAVEIIKARVQVLETARLHAIKMTHPEDWVLNKTRDERITGYLQDSGCERVRPILGISIFDVDAGQKVMADDGNSFAIVIRGRGRCGLTRELLDTVEGVRESTEDFAKDLRGIKQVVRVRQAARANLDGRIVRELAGLGSVPVEELARAWQGTEKKVEHCRKGRGFGSQDERHGGARAGEPDVEPPLCGVCGTKAALRKGHGKPDWYGCPNYEKHPAGKKWSIELPKWLAEVEQRKAQPAAASTPATTEAPAPAAAAKPAAARQQPKPMHADDIFGQRQPGEEG